MNKQIETKSGDLINSGRELSSAAVHFELLSEACTAYGAPVVGRFLDVRTLLLKMYREHLPELADIVDVSTMPVHTVLETLYGLINKYHPPAIDSDGAPGRPNQKLKHLSAYAMYELERPKLEQSKQVAYRVAQDYPHLVPERRRDSKTTGSEALRKQRNRTDTEVAKADIEWRVHGKDGFLQFFSALKPIDQEQIRALFRLLKLIPSISDLEERQTAFRTWCGLLLDVFPDMQTFCTFVSLTPPYEQAILLGLYNEITIPAVQKPDGDANKRNRT
jgi:hypothetical protein